MRWDIFCRVIDNYGDAGVCWRLASDLHLRGEQVRVYIDDPETLLRLAGQALPQSDVLIAPWPNDDDQFETADVADVVIEAFACDPPAAYVAAMALKAESGHSPAWINLEYLSAEAWIDAHHRLSSPHPRYSLTKYFYFPGFTPDSGGLLREPTLKIEPAESKPFDSTQPLRIFLFAYAQPALAPWLGKLDNTILSVAICPALEQIDSAVETLPLTLTLRYPAFVPQIDFDALLNEHDLLFIRGEDSFVRAQWAGKPVFWHIYPQDDGAHLEKLRAFYTRYLDPDTLLAPERETLMRFLLAWNGVGNKEDCALLWPEILQMLPSLQLNALRWRDLLLKQPDLVSQLRAFVSDLVK